MAVVAFSFYSKYFAAMANKETDWSGNTSLTLTLHTATYAPDLAVHDYVSDLTNELGTGGGYTAGGVALSNATITHTVANSWSQSWAAATAYVVGQIRRPTTGNLYVYRCVVAGTSHAATEPTWPTVVGTTVVDNGVTWECCGKAVVTLDADDLAPAWAAFSAGPFRHVVLSDRAPATDATRPLVGAYSYGSDQTGGGGDFDIGFDAGGIINIPVP